MADDAWGSCRYGLSRLVGLVLLSLVTLDSWHGRNIVPWQVLLPSWALMAVNIKWIGQIVSGLFKRRGPRKPGKPGKPVAEKHH